MERLIRLPLSTKMESTWSSSKPREQDYSVWEDYLPEPLASFIALLLPMMSNLRIKLSLVVKQCQLPSLVLVCSPSMPRQQEASPLFLLRSLQSKQSLLFRHHLPLHPILPDQDQQ